MNPQIKARIFAEVSKLMASVGYSVIPPKLSKQATATHGLKRNGLMLVSLQNDVYLMIYIYEWHVPESLKCVIGWAPKPILPAPLCAGQRASVDGVEFGEKSLSVELFNLVDNIGEPLATYRAEQEGWFLIPPEQFDFSLTEEGFRKSLEAQMVAISKMMQLDFSSAEAQGLAMVLAGRISTDLKTLAVPYLLRAASAQ